MNEKDTKLAEIFKERILSSAIANAIIQTYGEQFLDDIVMAVAMTVVATQKDNEHPVIMILDSAIPRYITLISRVYDIPMNDLKAMGTALMKIMIKTKQDVNEEHGHD